MNVAVVVDGPPPLLITVGSLAVAVADPPPLTLTWLVTDDRALADTFTVTVIAG
jgi:hypothetical protein